MKAWYAGLFTGCISIVSIPLAHCANTYSYLWVTGNSVSGSLEYNGPLISTIPGQINALNTGTMSVAYVDCTTTGNIYVYYYASDRWVFIPQKILIAGKDVKLMPSTPSGYANYGILNDYYILAQRGDIEYNAVYGGCGKIGGTYPINYIYPNITLTASVTGLPPGNYQGTIPVRLSYADYFGVSNSDITKFSDSLAFQYANISNIPYNIKITNSCTVSPDNISLSHGDLSIKAGDGNTTSSKLEVNCDSAASLTLSLTALTIPTQKYTDGIGVGLGNGWDTSLTIDNSGLTDSSPVKDISVPANTALTVRSTLKKTNNSTSGTSQGSAIIRVDIK